MVRCSFTRKRTLTVASIDLSELRTRFSHFVRRAERGEEFVVTRRGVPVAKLIAADPSAAAGTDKASG
jgi:prevent-host-death family protein